MSKDFLNELLAHKGKIFGTIIGLIIGWIVIRYGVIKGLFVALCVVIGSF